MSKKVLSLMLFIVLLSVAVVGYACRGYPVHDTLPPYGTICPACAGSRLNYHMEWSNEPDWDCTIYVYECAECNFYTEWHYHP